MGFSVDYHEGLGIISGRIEADFTKELAANYFAYVGQLAGQNGCTKLLTDFRGARLLATELELEDLCAELNTIGVSTAFKRAMVVNEDVQDYVNWVKNCFRHGARWIGLFFDKNMAESWLSEN